MSTNNLILTTGRVALLTALVLFPVACKRPQALLEISPASGCLDSPKTALQVTWDVRPLGLQESLIEVNALGVPPKLWMLEGAAGSKRTGEWALDGFTVTLRTRDGEQILARRTFVQYVCEAGRGGLNSPPLAAFSDRAARILTGKMWRSMASNADAWRNRV